MTPEEWTADLYAATLRSNAATPDPARAERVRARCHAVIRGRAPADRTLGGPVEASDRRRGLRLEPLVAAIVSGVFLVDVLRRAAALFAR